MIDIATAYIGGILTHRFYVWVYNEWKCDLAKKRTKSVRAEKEELKKPICVMCYGRIKKGDMSKHYKNSHEWCDTCY